MRPRMALDPEHRTLYSANLQPPPGYVFESAVATSFSLDFETALSVPVTLAMFASEDRDALLTNILALLEGVERAAGRLIVFTDAGRMHADPQPKSRLCALLERMIVEVAAPHKGAFHPKMWALRFRPIDPGERMRIRLLVLSRNLTRDRSWDVSLALDGPVTGRRRAVNKPLVEFLLRLPKLARAPVSAEVGKLVDDTAFDLHRADWELPGGFDEVSFAVNGLGRANWQPDNCDRLGVISPFCDAEALELLVGRSRAPPRLIGRPDELASIPEETLAGFAHVDVLDESAAQDDGDEARPCELQGLHAKVYVADLGWNTTLTVGSGNATCAGLKSGRNVELFATLKGKRSKIGMVENILGAEGIGRMCRPFVPGEVAALNAAQREAEKRLDAARAELCAGGVTLCCEPALADDGTQLWRIRLIPSKPLLLVGLRVVQSWPITRGQNHACEALNSLRRGEPCDLGTMALMDVTRFTAFRLEHGGGAELLFSTVYAIDGLPPERDAAILRGIIDSKDAFFRYLRLLLAERGDPFGAALAAHSGNGAGSWFGSADDTPLLEEMVRDFCLGGEQLRAIGRLLARLEPPADGPNPVPPEFRALWETFRVALDEGKADAARSV